MGHKLFIVHGSHPCDTVMLAMEHKGIPYRVVELPPALHAPIQRMIFGRRTVPGLKLDSGEKIIGSRAILRRLDELAPEPALLPEDPDARAAALRAEAWGDEVLQPLARRILWVALHRRPDAFGSFAQGSRLPTVPLPVLRLLTPGLARGEMVLNRAGDDTARADLRALPGHLDRIDGWIADGVMGGDAPNAADLQIATTVALLMTVADVRALVEGRPAGALARRYVPELRGEVPAGAIPAAWLPAVPAAA